MRLRIPMRRIVLFAAMFAVALVVFLPLRLVLGAIDSGFSAREASGPVWSGSLKEARIGPAALGDLDAWLAPTPLLVGRARLEFERDSAALDRLAGALGVARDRRSAESVTGIIPVDSLFAPLPIGSIALTDVTVRFRDGQCDSAEGLVRANLSPPFPASLSGAARCDRGALLLPLGSGGEGIALRIYGDGRYEAELGTRGVAPKTLRGRF